MNYSSNITGVIAVFCVVTTSASSPAYAVNCDRSAISLGDSLQKVTQTCRQPSELLHTFKRTRIISDSPRVGVHARRRDSYFDDLVYLDKQHHEKIVFRFRDEILTDIYQEFQN